MYLTCLKYIEPLKNMYYCGDSSSTPCKTQGLLEGQGRRVSYEDLFIGNRTERRERKIS